MPKFSKAHNSRKKIFGIFSKVNQVIYSSFPISLLSFNIKAQTDYEISCLQDFIAFFAKGHNSRKGQNPGKKKKIWINNFFMRNPYMKQEGHDGPVMLT